MDHARLSASASYRWMRCTASVQAIEKLFAEHPEKIKGDNQYTKEGTLAHEVAERKLQGKTVNPKCTKEMYEYVMEYVDAVRAVYDPEQGDILYIEERVDYSDTVPEGYGTLDALVVQFRNRTAHSFDLKYGAGVQVEAEENSQQLLYCLGILQEFEWMDLEGQIDQFMINIVMPRKFTPPPWKATIETIRAFAIEAKSKAHEALGDDPVFTPGEKQCQFCDNKPYCAALDDFSTELTIADFDDMDIEEDVAQLTDERRRLILDNASVIRNYLSAVEDYAHARLMAGEKFPGYKLVEGRSNRKATEASDKYAQRILGAKVAFEKKFIGITKAKKLMNKQQNAHMDGLMVKPRGKPTLAPMVDKRPVYLIDVSEDFDKLD